MSKGAHREWTGRRMVALPMSPPAANIGPGRKSRALMAILCFQAAVKLPDRPPVFSTRRISVIFMARSTALHMS